MSAISGIMGSLATDQLPIHRRVHRQVKKHLKGRTLREKFLLLIAIVLFGTCVSMPKPAPAQLTTEQWSQFVPDTGTTPEYVKWAKSNGK